MLSLTLIIFSFTLAGAIPIWDPTGPYHPPPSSANHSPAFANGTSPHPTLFFTPGAGLPASAYTAYLSELASYGHAVVAIDHPGEAPYLPLPYGGGGVYGYPDFSAYPPTPAEARAVYAFRVAAASKPFFPSLVRLYGAPFNLTHFGVFGHSVGGAAAAGVMAAEGDVFGGDDPGVAAPDLASVGPFLEVGSEAHFEGNASSDATWAHFNGAQTGWVRDVQVDGTRHLDFSDIPLWIDLLDQRGVLNRTWVGPIDGVRVTTLTTALLRELFANAEGNGVGWSGFLGGRGTGTSFIV
ncbi:hypothetical protein DIS24_g773 [Lasiodiplodia hormozganensis]|uniref:1-alkyl-2-acetylglycerophosphocholine esterase n=1 Tax=Lasiodiplodia hormozganensis TaxID=869390 RepID=A0AA40D8L9_9PEZI|nr:hypothetical protein DIS24_g773 [Lasiodiplodia hormozganensis]